jgi:hypothetical protein
MHPQAILLVFIIFLKALIPAMDTAELAKIPLLFDHYQDHRKQDTNISFMAFLALHYADSKHHEEDHTTHSKLPFGQHHHLNIIITAWFAPTLPEFLLPPQPQKVEHNSMHFPQELSAHAISIWQPPRLV